MAAAAAFLPFLPLLPAQILLNNFLSDLPAITIGGDRVDAEAARKPGRWDIHAIRSFMFLFGAISSAFDLLTFGALVLLRTDAPQFRSVWFLVSLWTEICILLVMRTHRPFFRSRPSTALVVTSLATIAAALVPLYVPAIARMFDFVPLGAPLLAMSAGITAAYVAVSELAKYRFFTHTWKPGELGVAS
jgi:Mg2+-importing ATPase